MMSKRILYINLLEYIVLNYNIYNKGKSRKIEVLYAPLFYGLNKLRITMNKELHSFKKQYK